MTPTLDSITIYPIKSTRGVALQAASVRVRGLDLDRRWMLVDGRGSFITARKHPRLVLVRARVQGTGLSVEAPGMTRLDIADARGTGAMLDVQIWRSALPVRHVAGRADTWFSAYLGIECRLVHMGESEVRGINPDYARPGDQVSFADGYPLLLVAQASLDDLNARTAMDVSMRRFRPNLVVRGGDAFAEDRWRRLRIGDVEFEAPKRCDRCVLTTIDPDTAEKHQAQEPLRTLSQYRRDKVLGVLFGLNLIPRSAGMLRLGDAVQVLD